MTSDSNRRSLHEPLSGDPVRGALQQGLVVGVPSPQGVEVDPFRDEIELGANQAVHPGWSDRIGAAQQPHFAALAGPAQEDHTALQGALEVRGPTGRECTSWWAQADPGHPADAVGMFVGATEAGIVVELGVPGQADGPPVLEQQPHGRFRRDVAERPGGGQAAMQRDPGDPG